VWETIEASPSSLVLSEEHRDLLEKRVAELEQNPDATTGLDQMLQQVRVRG
jgi:putative addiction module component (TIGR02574 family)